MVGDVTIPYMLGGSLSISLVDDQARANDLKQIHAGSEHAMYNEQNNFEPM